MNLAKANCTKNHVCTSCDTDSSPWQAFKNIFIYLQANLLKVINNIHLPEFLFFLQAFERLCGVRLQGKRITKIGDRYVKYVARIHMK